MRTIDVSTTTFALIWAHRVEGEENEDAILRRILSSGPSPVGAESPSLPATPQGDRRWKKITWASDIVEVLEQRGGRATLQEIYDDVRVLRRVAGRSVPRSLDATVRRTLEDHCKESKNFRAENLFEMTEGKGQGVWGLRQKG